MSDFSIMELVLLGFGLLATGALAGLAAGLLGVGGGIIVVPVLYQLFTSIGIAEEVRMHVAVGTSLATIVATSASSMRAHWRHGAIDRSLLFQWLPWILSGVLVGTALAAVMKGNTLVGLFAAVLLLLSIRMGLGNPSWTIADKPPVGMLRAVIGALIGGLSTMMGLGGGSLMVPTLTLFGYPIHRAVGTGSAVGCIIGIPGAIGFVLTGLGAEGLPPFSLGYVSLLGLALILPTSMLVAPLGARLAYKLNTVLLRRAFAVFLALTALKMLHSALT